MADIFTNKTYKSRSLGDQYLFYESLKNSKDAYLRTTYKSVSNRLKDYMESRANYEEVGYRLRDFAYMEFEKEQEYLHSIFGATKMHFYELGNAKEFADTLKFYNNFLNYKDILKRNIDRIKNYEKAKIDLSSFGPSYMSQAWKKLIREHLPEIIQAIENKGFEQALNILETEVAKIFNEELPERAVHDMFESETFNKNEKVEHDNIQAYKELSDALGFMGRDDLGRQLMELYGASDLKDFFLKTIIGTNNNKVTTTIQLKNKLKNAVKESKRNPDKTDKSKGFLQIGFDNRKTGIGSELLETCKNQILNGIAHGSKGRTVVDANVGGANARPDIISVSCEVQYTSQMTDAFNEYNNAIGKQYRTIATSEARKLSDAIESINSAVIIYENTKNSFMGPLQDVVEDNKIYRAFSGFSAGTAANAEEMGQIMGDPQRAGAIYQTIKGTIGSNINHYEEKVRKSLAEDIAYFLFDDFEAKGNAAGITTKSSLHIFSLVGIKVPLSFLLFQLSKAFLESSDPIDMGMMEISISKPDSTLYPSDSITKYRQVLTKEGISPSEAWENQREEARRNVKIHFNFFKNFFAMIKSSDFNL